MFHVSKQWLEEGKGNIFTTQDVSCTKNQVLDSINSLTDEQVYAVSAFIRYLTEDNSK
ncbi:MAG: hypothetical protein MSH20_08310 [Lachnospiraceae bacterium]|nr:hypothetical protein [Lachnospiraceae bacterium]